MKPANKTADKLAAVFFPKRCCGCGRIICADEELCEICEKNRAHFVYERGYCKNCGQIRNNCICENNSLFNKAVFAFFYTGRVKYTVRRFKFDGDIFYGRLFAEQMYKAAAESGILTDANFVVPVPIHGLKKLRRGFNQSDMIAREFSKLSGIPYLNALKKITYTRSQHNLSILERSGNVAGTFEVRKKHVDAVENAKIILVDDIMTTHSTMNEATKTLLVFGADNVDALTVAVPIKDRNRD